MSGSYLSELTEVEELNEAAKKRLERLYYHCNVRLGGTSIPVHLEDDDYTYAFESAVNMYRTRSSRSINQTFGYIELQPSQATYQLHQRVDVVKRIARAGAGFGGTGQLGSFESFGAATLNSLLRGVAGGAGGADLATWDFTAQYMETIERLFAREINFSYRDHDQTLMIHQVPRSKEWILLEVSVLKSLSELLSDHWAYDWLQKYTLAICKTILGEKYSLFATISGPQGGSVMKGEQLKQAGHDEMILLEDDLMVWGDSADIPLPIRG